MYIHRAIEPLLKEALLQFPAVLLTGPRQAGKSTLLQHTLKNYQYVTLDDPMIRAMANNDPELFLSTHETPLIIDEIQYAPELLSYLKIRIDKNRKEHGRYVLTGSQTFQLMRGVSESLAGRIAILQLYPLSWEEIDVSPLEDKKVAKQIVQGFYPQFFSEPRTDWNLWYSSYIATYLERDLRNIKSISDLGRFQTFLSLLASRAGNLLNMAELAKECGISQPTVKDWISILESTYIIFLLKPYHNNRTKRLTKSPKVFFVDTGLLCYLLGMDVGDRLFKASIGGHIFENMVIAEFIKKTSKTAQRIEYFFYRTAAGVEIDLLVERSGKIEAYEIKFAKTLSRDMAKSLSLFASEHKVEKSTVLSLCEMKVPLVEGVFAEHWSSLH